MEIIDTQIKNRKWNLKKWLLYAIIFLFMFYILSFFVKIIYVVNVDTSLPIRNAKVVTYYSNWADGCGKPTTEVTNALGFVFSFGAVCKISVEKENYHINGLLNNGNLIAQIKMNKITNAQNPVIFSRKFFNGEGMDMLSYFHDLNTLVPENMFLDKQLDFTFNNTVITFNGDGGVQEIDKSYPTVRTTDQKFFNIENLLFAPKDGYVKSIELKHGRAYVAKLADGVHYMKFISITWKDQFPTKEGVCLRVFVQTEASNNLEFINIINDGNFGNGVSMCDEDTMNPSDYDKKIKYLKMKEDFSKLQKVTEDTHTRLITESGYTLITGFRSENMKGRYVAIIAPTYEQVKSFYIKRENDGKVFEWFDPEISVEVYKDFNMTPLK